MTLRNEIFEGLGAAKAAQDLVYNPRDDYYEQLAEVARRKNRIDREADAARNAPQGGTQQTVVPKAASTATPGPNLTPPVAIATNAPQQQFRRGGSVQRFADGGEVRPDDAPDENEAELIVQGILGRDRDEMVRRAQAMRQGGERQAALNTTIGPPPDDDPESIAAGVEAGAAPIRRGQQEAVNRQLPAPPGSSKSAPGPLTMPTSKAGEWYERNVMRPVLGSDREDPRTEQGFDEKWLSDIDAKLAQLRVGGMESVTPEERERREAEVAELEKEKALGPPSKRIADRAKAFDDSQRPPAPTPVPTPAAGATPPAGAAAAAQAPGAQPAPPTPPVTVPATPPGPQQPPFNQPLVPQQNAMATTAPPPPGSKPDMDVVGAGSAGARWANPNKAPAGVTPPAGTNPPATSTGPGTTGSNGPGSGAGATPAPPAGTTPSAAPAPGYSADPNKAYDPAAAGRLNPDGTFRQAMDTGAPPSPAPPPGAERTPPSGMVDTRGDAQGGMSSNNAVADLKATLAGAHSQARPGPDGMPHVGQDAITRPTFRAFVAANNQGGQLTPGNAMLRGMVGAYMVYAKYGEVEKANKMAYGIVQAANLEMASYGAMAVDQLRRGDSRGALQSIVAGADYAPDGMNHRVAADGRTVETVDPRTGKVTGQTPVDGRWILAAALGMRNGTLMWNSLQLAAQQAMHKQGDPDAKVLQNLINMERLEGLKLRNAKARGGGGGGMNTLDEQTRRLLSGTPQTGGSRQPGPSAEEIAYDRDLDTEPA